jgi:hypothetical protein
MCQSFIESRDAAAWEKLLLIYFLDAHIRSLHPSDSIAELALKEHHLGTVDRVTDSVVVVRYGKGDDAFESEYDRRQFSEGTIIQRGDKIEAAIGLWHQKHIPRGIDHLLSENEQKDLDRAWNSPKGLVVGDINL